jgi:hypothetical protein
MALDALMCAKYLLETGPFGPTLRSQMAEAVDLLQEEACRLGAYQWGFVPDYGE